MLVELDQKVVDYLHKKNKTVLTLNIVESGGGCCPTVDSVELSYSEPTAFRDNFHEFEQDGIRIFIGNEVKVLAAKLRFVLEKGLLGQSIVPTGIQVRGK